MKRLLLWIALLILAVGQIAASGTVDLAEIEANPRKYVGTSTAISGEITKITNVPFTDFQIQTLYDRTATMPLITVIPRSVGETFQGNAQIVGLNTQGAEGSSEKWVQNLADLFVRQKWMSPEEAEKTAQKLHALLVTLFRGMEVSLMAVEDDPMGPLEDIGSDV